MELSCKQYEFSGFSCPGGKIQPENCIVCMINIIMYEFHKGNCSSCSEDIGLWMLSCKQYEFSKARFSIRLHNK
jgi:hypothetical protein